MDKLKLQTLPIPKFSKEILCLLHLYQINVVYFENIKFDWQHSTPKAGLAISTIS